MFDLLVFLLREHLIDIHVFILDSIWKFTSTILQATHE